MDTYRRQGFTVKNQIIFGMLPMQHRLHDAAYYLDCALNSDGQDAYRDMFLHMYEEAMRMATNEIFRNRFDAPHIFLN